MENSTVKIIERYASESGSNCNLGCGGNLGHLDVKSGEMVLDLGCGRGEETIAAAMLAGPDGIATGLDLTPAMIESAHKNAEGIGLANIRFLVGDIQDLPWEDGCFDAVMSNCVINHAENKNKAYSEIFRVLKPSGRFVISDAVTKTALPPEIKNDPDAWAQCFGGAVTEQEYLGSISSAGFGTIEILKRREYIKNGHDFISLTIRANKQLI